MRFTTTLATCALALLATGCATVDGVSASPVRGNGVKISASSSLSADRVTEAAELVAMSTRTSFIRNRGFGSMRPVFDTNSLLLVEEDCFESLRVGDIVIFSNDRGALVSHRIIERRGDRFWTMGDNNARPDNLWVTRANFRYRVWGVLHSGDYQLGTQPRSDTASGAAEASREADGIVGLDGAGP